MPRALKLAKKAAAAENSQYLADHGSAAAVRQGAGGHADVRAGQDGAGPGAVVAGAGVAGVEVVGVLFVPLLALPPHQEHPY